MSILLELKNISKYFPYRSGLAKRVLGEVRAVDGVSFGVEGGKTTGLVGESGCGKTTLAKIAVGIMRPTRGEVSFEGERGEIQMVFQDPFNALNPRMKVDEIVLEPLIVRAPPRFVAGRGLLKTASQRREKAKELLESVELSGDYGERYPHEFSGGERQRIGIARALASRPKLVILDEPVSNLDVSIQAQILNLLLDVQDKFKVAYMLITHDLRVVEHMSDEVVVMYFGKIVERASNEELSKNPLHPYTKLLFEAAYGDVSKVEALRAPLQMEFVTGRGDIPSPIHPPSGCRFRTRCPNAFAPCEKEEPQLLERAPGHFAACHLYGE